MPMIIAQPDVKPGSADRAIPDEPLVSIIICVYNAGEYLKPSLLSILNQTYNNLDILIVDDGSTDGCFATVEDLLTDRRIRVFRQPNMMKPAALNRALDEARGEFYAIHDADDISYPARIEKQVRALRDRPRVAAVFCGHELIINGKSLAPIFASKSEAECARAIQDMQVPAHDPTGMYRMSLAGGLRYERSLQSAEGVDYIWRLGEQHPMLVLGECLYRYRIHPESLTRRDPAQREQFVAEAQRRACERRGLDYLQIFPKGLDTRRRSRASIDDNNLAAHFIMSAADQCRVGRRWAALRTGIACARLQPLDPYYYKALVYALVSPAAVDFVRRRIAGRAGR